MSRVEGTLDIIGLGSASGKLVLSYPVIAKSCELVINKIKTRKEETIIAFHTTIDGKITVKRKKVKKSRIFSP